MNHDILDINWLAELYDNEELLIKEVDLYQDIDNEITTIIFINEVITEEKNLFINKFMKANKINESEYKVVAFPSKFNQLKRYFPNVVNIITFGISPYEIGIGIKVDVKRMNALGKFNIFPIYCDIDTFNNKPEVKKYYWEQVFKPHFIK